MMSSADWLAWMADNEETFRTTLSAAPKQRRTLNHRITPQKEYKDMPGRRIQPQDSEYP